MIDYQLFLAEGRRKRKPQDKRRVSQEDSYFDDMEYHGYHPVIIDDIKKVVRLMKAGKDSVLESDYKSHELDDELRGFSSLHLYPGEKKDGPKDVVILFKVHSNDHLVLHGIGTMPMCIQNTGRYRPTRNRSGKEDGGTDYKQMTSKIQWKHRGDR